MIENYQDLKQILINKRDIQNRSTEIPVDNEYNISAAVLVPFVIFRNEISLIFTKRTISLAHHSGQVSFPGGVKEKYDTSHKDTALRETREEIGIIPKNIEILAELPVLNSTTGFSIAPLIGWIHDLNAMKPNIFEVEKIFTVPYSWIADPANSYQADYVSNDKSVNTLWYFYSYSGEIIWGITAKILKQVVELIEK